MSTIELQQAEGHLGEIVGRLAPGEEVILTKQAVPVDTIRAIDNEPRPVRKFGTLHGTVLYMAPDFDEIPEGFEEYLL